MPDAYDQSRYQIRFEWGAAGLARLAASDIVVVVDVLSSGTEIVDAVAARGSAPADEGATTILARAAAETGALVFVGALRNAGAVADAVLAAQQQRGARTSVAVLAAGDEDAAGVRFAVEDQLGSGAVIDALGALGLDHTSPESAASCEAFRGLRGAVRHLLTAAGTGQALLEQGGRDAVVAAALLDQVTAVPVLRGEAYEAFAV